MCGEETVSAALFKYIEPVCDHEFVVERPYTAYCMFDDVRYLIAESEGEKCACKYYEASFPSELPDEKCDYCDIHRSPYQLV